VLRWRGYYPEDAIVIRPWLIRVASDPVYGGGHVRRCWTLAKALAQFGPVAFVVDVDRPDWVDALHHPGITIIGDGNEPPGPYAGSILDHYGFSHDDAANLAHRAPPLAVFDDFLDPPGAASMIINAGTSLERDQVRGIPALLGLRYSLVENDLIPASPKVAQPQVRNILISFGLLDSKNATGLALQALENLAASDKTMRVTVAMGRAAPHSNAVQAALARWGDRGKIVFEAEMGSLYAEADLAVGTGGVSLLERMAAGVPSVVIATSENQTLAIQSATDPGAILSAGSIDELSVEELADLLARVCSDQGGRSRMMTQGRVLVDGKGAQRIAKSLVQMAIENA
jgi:spore coat polysaccharide biosynthesis predicted glycosyltransferase SpsG